MRPYAAPNRQLWRRPCCPNLAAWDLAAPPLESLHQLVGNAADDVSARPIAHSIDPDNQAAGREPTQVIVALNQQHIRAEASRSYGRRGSRRAAAYHQHIGLGDHGELAGRLKIGELGPLAPGVRPTAEDLEALLRADGV